MPKVFYTGHSRESPPPEREWTSGDSASEAETDVEAPAELTQLRTRPKSVHRRTESMDTAPTVVPSAKRTRRAGNAVFRQRESSREIRDATGQRPLQKACSRSDYSRVLMLLERSHPDLQDRDYAGTTALHTAALQGDDRIVAALLQAGAVPDVRSGPEELDTPLMDAAANGFLPVVELLLKHGADPRITNAMGRLAVDFVEEADREDPNGAAITKALSKRMSELRRAGAPLVDSPTHPLAPKGLFPPGFVAVQRPTAPAFLDLTRRSTREEIAEHASMGNLEYVGSALERGWRPSGDALVKAARYGHAEIVGLLLAFGLDANTKVNGTTPLREAIKRDHAATVKLLLESGSSAQECDKKLVVDLPAHDELRAIVLGVMPAPTPETLKAEPNSKAVDTGATKPEAGQADHIEAKNALAKTHESQPAELKKQRSATSEEARRTRDSVSRVKKPSASTPRDSPGPQSKQDLKPVLPDSKALKSSKSDFELSKLDLRSIKPKKKPKSIREEPALPSAVRPTSASPISPSTVPTATWTDPTEQGANGERVTGETVAEANGEANGDAPHKAPNATDANATDANATDASATRLVDVPAAASISPASTGPESADGRPLPETGTVSEKPTLETGLEGPTREVSPLTDVAGKNTAAFHEATNNCTANAVNGAKERSLSVAESPKYSPKDSPRESPTPSEVWAERSQELRQLAERKQKERKDREARMLESLAQEQRRRSESEEQNQRRSSEAAPESSESTPRRLSPVPAPMAQQNADHAGTGQTGAGRASGDTTQEEDSLSTKEPDLPMVSVKSFPWALRQLAYTGKAQPAAPLFVYEVNGVPSYVDVQVSLVTGDVTLHSRYPNLTKTVMSSHHKLLLWPFCRAWICRTGARAHEVEDDRKKFVELPLTWVPVSEVDAHAFEGTPRPSVVAIQLEMQALPSRPINSEVPLWWQSRLSTPGRAW